MNGSIVSSSGVTVNTGGTLGGTGALPTTTINGGNLSPGNSIGTITINGSLSFVGPGNYIVEVSPAAADKTNVTGAPGTASLAGTLSAVGIGGVYTVGTKYTVLNATGGVSGTFANLAISGSFGVTKPHIEYDANNVYLVLDPNAISPFLVGATPNQRAVAGAVDTAIVAGSQSAPFLALFNLTAAQLPGALDQLSGEVHASTAGALLDESLYPRSAVLGRLRQASYGGDTQMASLSAGGPQAFSAGEELSALAYGKSPIVTKAPPMVSQPGYDVVFWAQGFGARGKFDSRRQCHERAARSRGLLLRRRHARRNERACRHRGGLHRLEVCARRARLIERRDRAPDGLWRLELRRAQSARGRRPCVAFDRHQPHCRVPRLLR